MIPFNAKITGKNDIKNYADYLYDHAGSFIMSWIIEGAKKAVEMDFKVPLPKVVEDAIEAYREDNDWMGHFLADCCDVDKGASEKSGELYQAYRAYCLQNGEFTRSTTDFLFSDRKGRLCQTQDALRNYGSWPEFEGRTGLPGLKCRSCKSME